MKAVFLSDKGKVRQHNEDSAGVFHNLDGDILAVVADGMGGHRAGDVASSMAIQLFHDYWKQTYNMNEPKKIEEWLHNNVEMINERIYEYSKQHVECSGMGTTIIAAICTKGFVTIGHIGDSRCYMISDGEMSLVTEDHSLVNELVRHGEISKEDAEYHPKKNVLLRALGTEEKVGLDVKTLVLEENDQLLLCSDGLSNKVAINDMQRILQLNEQLETKGEHLIQLANDRGGEDNITLVIVDYADSANESR
ncbi:Stp1/IreP family PP2C-type Ser/Thr phosphatase [Bacillus cytotoxicus]|uniref:protein-serine/threonine phosphatase n=2 Tax=Bacillus cytotoxicus TaxID=580165 RepID=A0AAX2CIY0_9BACI|nr:MULTISPECIES: Stp1/IreP family PP2C-type Ser/Thr phosphatase [Bacillus cereus group]ABS22751.1 Protein phosphatase 2C-like protein [Bacillus cytotoxicus NVH 391-98]AWC29416.1 serine/threonine-protein phosphatase [Bacillus cytotoxicus]AWC33427.1 serine/threonine-protein phosphatase [Bacillus cytotoxicus]AWC37407.1 serine/threonine-protein phosphatase [Bacillus cytotoxicus]AWC41545.1 serine/threonine-protein phosphatase [Bacillus cytotoxicus]